MDVAGPVAGAVNVAILSLCCVLPFISSYFAKYLSAHLRVTPVLKLYRLV